MSTPRLAARVRRISLVVALVLGALDAWFFRQWNLNPDGVSYFDLARAVAAHGIGAVINGYWSPLYPLTIGAALKLYRPDADSMFPMVRAVNLLIYVGATFSFDRLLRVVCARSSGFNRQPAWAQSAAVIAAWSTYLLLVLKGIGLHLVTPDMGVTLLVFWAAAELVQLATAPMTLTHWARLGALLAVGYWWKAILFPVGGVALLIAFWIAWRRRDGWEGPIAGGASFGALALVLLVPLSFHVGRPTFGETGRLNQLWFVNEAPHLTTLCAGPGTTLPLTRVRAVRTDSIVTTKPLTCALPDRWPTATLPLWYDASWWYADTKGYFDAGETRRAVQRDVVYVRDALVDAAPWLSVALCLAALLALLTRSTAPMSGPLVVLAIVPVLFYLLVYVELRHIVPFLVCGALVAIVALLDGAQHWRGVAVVAVALVALSDMSMHVSEPLLVELSILRHEVRGDVRAEQGSMRVARALEEKGLHAGDRVATINTVWNVDWAQRAGLLVRAYTPEYTVSVVHTVRELRDPCVRASYAAALARLKITAVVLLAPNGYSAPPDFERLGDTGYYLMLITRANAITPASCTTF
jgi:hypothetical protein